MGTSESTPQPAVVICYAKVQKASADYPVSEQPFETPKSKDGPTISAWHEQAERPAVEYTRLQRGGAVLYHMSTSITTQSATKALMTVFAFNFPITVCLLQMAFIAPVSALLGGATVTLAQLWALVPLGLMNSVNIVSGLAGTGGLSVPMFIVLRRFTMLFTVLLEYYLYNKRAAWQVWGSVGIMIFGALIAAATDLSFNLYGYVAVLMNDLFTALYLVMIKNYKAAKEVNTAQLLFCNSIVSMLPLLLVSCGSGELLQILQFEGAWRGPFMITLALATCLGLSINHSTYVCTRVNEPLTTSVAGSFKNVIMTLIGVFAFGDFVGSTWNTVGIVVSMMGAVWYACHCAMQKSTQGKVSQRRQSHRGSLESAR